MRKLPLLLGLLACIPLAGCNWWPGHEPAPQRVIVTCHCTPPIRGAVGETRTRAAEAHAYRRTRHSDRRYAHHYAYDSHHDARGSRRYIWHKREAEASVDRYGYSSSSRSYGSSTHGDSYSAGHGESRMSYGGSDDAGHGDLQGRTGSDMRVWSDGYGRRHLYDQSAVRHYSYDAHMRQKETPARLDPWHFYNDDWD